MNKDEFLAIRKAPRGRAGVFDVEALLMKDLKGEDLQKKAAPPSAEQNFTDAANKVFTESMPADLMGQMFMVIKILHHWQDLDPYVLAIAARLRLLYPSGLDPNGAPPSNYLTPRGFQEDVNIDHWISVISEKADEETKAGYRADILAYYKMFFLQ